MANNSTFSLYISLSLLLLNLTSAFSPTDQYLLNCGSSAPKTLDPDHRPFIGDAPRFSTSTRSIQLQNTDSGLGSSSSPLYDTARAFFSPVRYAFPIKDQGTHHLVRLHFHPVCNDRINLHEAQFHVLANGFLLLRDFRINKADSLPVLKEFMIPIDTEKLEIELIPSVSSQLGFVSAIEVFSAPKDVVADVAQFVGLDRNDKVNGLLNNGFEMVHRVNIGGFKITPFNDSMWRTWVTDDQHFSVSEGSGDNVETLHFGGRIKYQPGGASREVGPDNVYNTARVIKSLDNAVPNVNMTWKFGVEKGYNYMVRMHYCDIASMANSMLFFNAYVNGNLAYEDLDLTAHTNGRLASPFYADFVVDEVSSGVLEVSVGPSNISLPHAVDAILNGVEIWKLNNSMGSFGGEVCAEFVRRSWRSEHVGISVPLVVFAAFILLGASVVLQRMSSSMGFTRLPVHASEVNLRGGNQLASYKI